MYDNPEQAKLAALIISIVILIIIVIIIVIVCCNWNSLNANNANNTNTNIPNPQALAAAAMYNKNQGVNLNMAANAAANAVKNNPQKALLGAYAYQNRDNFRGGGGMGGRMGGGMGGRSHGQILDNINNARNGVSGSDWANWIANGAARTVAQNKLQMHQNSGCPAGSHMTQGTVTGVCGQSTTSNGAVTTHCSGIEYYAKCIPNTNIQASGCPVGSHMTQVVTSSNICGPTATANCVSYKNVLNTCVPE